MQRLSPGDHSRDDAHADLKIETYVYVEKKTQDNPESNAKFIPDGEGGGYFEYRANVLSEMNKLGDFNPALQGSNRFAIVSGKPFTVELAYSVDEDWESGMSRDYFLHSDPQLVATYYPEERVISIFE